MKKMLKELCNNQPENIDEEEILSFVEDILRYLEDDCDNEYETNQGMLGMKNIFRGYVIKVWKGTNFEQKKYRKLNRIVVRLSVQYYYECWIERNKIYHNESVQAERIIN